MATAVATVTVTQQNSFVFGNKYVVIGSVAITASPATYATGGLAMSFFQDLVKASLPPAMVIFTQETGYDYQYIPGADASAGLLKIFVQDGVSGNPLAEMTNATAIPAAVSGDTINFIAIFNGML
jgi:hypothetical protein